MASDDGFEAAYWVSKECTIYLNMDIAKTTDF